MVGAINRSAIEPFFDNFILWPQSCQDTGPTLGMATGIKGVEAPSIAVTKTKNPHASRLLSFGSLNLTSPLGHPTLKDVNVLIAITFEAESRTLGGPESLVY